MSRNIYNGQKPNNLKLGKDVTRPSNLTIDLVLIGTFKHVFPFFTTQVLSSVAYSGQRGNKRRHQMSGSEYRALNSSEYHECQ